MKNPKENGIEISIFAWLESIHQDCLHLTHQFRSDFYRFHHTWCFDRKTKIILLGNHCSHLLPMFEVVQPKSFVVDFYVKRLGTYWIFMWTFFFTACITANEFVFLRLEPYCIPPFLATIGVGIFLLTFETRSDKDSIYFLNKIGLRMWSENEDVEESVIRLIKRKLEVSITRMIFKRIWRTGGDLMI